MNFEDMERMRRILRHRLRNAVSGVKVATCYLADQLGDTIEPRLREYFPLIERECDAICDITERLESYFRPLPDKDPVPIKVAIHSALEDIHKTHPSIEIDCQYEISEPEHSVCRSLVHSVVRETIINAHESIMRPVHLLIHEQDERYYFRVIDQGEGIPEEEKDLAFRPFHTTRSRSLGLGLAIAHRHVKDHGGSVTTGHEERGHFVEFAVPKISDQAANESELTEVE